MPLYKVEVEDEIKRLLPSKTLRWICGWIYLICFSTIFLTLPLCSLLLFPVFWTPERSKYSIAILVSVMISMLLPVREWPYFRKLGQLWYEIFDFHCNLSPLTREKYVHAGDSNQFIIGMHPHGIIPLQAILWAAFCDSHLSITTKEGIRKELYGFGAAADVVGKLPFLRNVMGWLSAGSASYGVLKNGLLKGESAACNAVNRKPRNLYILPGGIAEIFCSQPKTNIIVFRKRKGLCRLALETGALLIPCYVFGGTDFFYNLSTAEGFVSRFFRKLQLGITIFWGRFCLPIIPFTPKVTIVIADPIPVVKWDKPDTPIPDELIDGLHSKYLEAIERLFEDNKIEAGYPDAKLEIR
jgi:hypothetical protein